MLESEKINYNVITYNTQDNQIDGVSVAKKIGRDPKVVFKILVVQGNKRNVYVFIIPVKTELDLKKAAKTVGEKKVEMVAQVDPTKELLYMRLPSIGIKVLSLI